MRVGLIGVGSAGRRGHLPSIARLEREGLLELVATADHHNTGATACACGSQPAKFRDGAQLLESVEVDLVVLASEPASHADLIQLAAERGRHVLCEKPLTVTVAQHDRLTATLPRHAAFVAVHQYRYSPLWTPIAQWARRAAHLHLPASISVEVQRHGTDAHASAPWRADRANSGGTLADHAPHFLALAWTITHDLTPQGAQRTSYGDGTETVCAHLLASGGQMNLRVTTAAEARHTRLELQCAGARFSWADRKAALAVAGQPVREWFTSALSDRQHVDSLYLPLYRDLLRNISDAAWRQERRVEALAVNSALVQLLASANGLPR
jgi:predicted dehydrogenase